jgi:hypothetical protein
LGTLPKVKVAGKGSEDIFILRRFKNNRIITFAYNRSENDFEGSITDCKVQIPGCGSILLEKDTAVNVNYKLPETISSSMTEDPIELSNKWEVIFEANHVPFNYWHVKNDNKFMLTGKDEPVFADSGFDLMQKEYPPEANDDGKSWYNCRFMVTGEISDAHLVLEESSITGNWKLYVNGNLITDWERTKVYDCRNLTANIGHAIKGNNTPTLNIITIETNGKRRGLKEVLYLYGSFLCEYKYAHLSLPFLKGSKNRQFLDNLLPWDVCGYPTFSGSAKYSRKLSIKDNGNYLLDLGRVEDIAEVIIDGKQQEVIAWPPYNCKIDNLSAGKHHLEVIVTNPPANRNRAAGLPSGLLGPVKLYRYK